ncbi:MAG: substrate-binding domain-containing protein, partial [Kiritimatiellae bacterium]|nr:substrate-binding domain-containing protein [Kiritimatiellia bacterium]
MNGKARPVRDVIVLVNLRYASGRRVLSGVFNYLADGHPWRVRILQSNDEFTEGVAAQAETTGVDGMILTLPGQPGALEKAAASDIPAVFMNLDGEALRKRTNAAIITVDNAAIGQEGARHLLSCGKFASFAFVHGKLNHTDWSRVRAEAFRQTLASSGSPYAEYPPRETIGDDADLRDLSDFLLSLPKPTGVMALFDGRATHVLNACASVGLDVPGHVALIGVDNDESFCDFSSPTLSSVQPDFEGGGRMAAEALETIMAKRRT